MNSITLLGMVSMFIVIGFTWNTARTKNEGFGQSKRDSLIEAWTNIGIGFSINFITNIWLIPMMTGVELPHSANFWGGWVYTTISIARQYGIRRWFNTMLHKPA